MLFVLDMQNLQKKKPKYVKQNEVIGKGLRDLNKHEREWHIRQSICIDKID